MVVNLLNYILVVDYIGMIVLFRCREGYSQVDVRVLGYRDYFFYFVQYFGSFRVEGYYINYIYYIVYLVVFNF